MDKLIDLYLNEADKPTKMSAKEAKEIAQDELLDSLSSAFYKLGDGYITRQDGSKLTKDEEDLIQKQLQKQIKRIGKMFGYSNYKSY